MSKTLTDIDKEIGSRIRAFRKANKLSQTDVAKTLGVTFQQVQKYEKGTNRVSVSSFITICKALSLDPADIIGIYFGKGDGHESLIAKENSILRAKLDHIKSVAA